MSILKIIEVLPSVFIIVLRVHSPMLDNTISDNPVCTAL